MKLCITWIIVIVKGENEKKIQKKQFQYHINFYSTGYTLL